MRRILYNKYEVLKPIAEGGMGSVWLVKDLHLNKLAAVKINHPCTNHNNQSGVLQEREVLKQLSHPMLPHIIDFFQEGGSECLVMEYVEGITLEQYLRRFGAVKPWQAVAWGVELTEVLHYLHSQNPPIIYRDLKPANIMIKQDGKLKLIDFGTAASPAFGQKREMFITGTPEYSAPEQWKEGNVGKKSDIYALGAVLHEMLTGIRPNGGIGERRPVREYDRSIPSELEKIILTCTRKQPQERYASMEQVKTALLTYKKNGFYRKVVYSIKREIGSLLWLLAICRTVLPFLQGVKAEEVPFPFLLQPLFLFAVALLYYFFIVKKQERNRFIKKHEKSVFLTEKRYAGLYKAGIFILLFLQLGMVHDKFLQAAEESPKLWVEMRDEQNRKLLLKEGAIYHPEQKIRFDIPVQELPQGIFSVQIVAVKDTGEIYESRVFLVEGN